VVLLAVGFSRPADADVKKDIQTKIKEAMENYDLFEYEESRKLLNTALTMAKKAKMEGDKVVAQVHVALGIVYFAGLKDEPSAKLSFLSAVEIDPAVQIDAAYRSAEMAKVLEEARSESSSGGGGGGGGSEPAGNGAAKVDCTTVTGLQHEIVETAKSGARKDLEAFIGGDVTASKVVIKYRRKGAETFAEATMEKKGDCKYVGAIPADAMSGDLLHYYVAALGGDGKEVASKGSEGSPNIIEIAAAGPGGAADDDNPLGPKDNGNNVTGGVVVGGKKSTIFLAVAVGTGAGYVTGETEQQMNKVECCLAPGLVSVLPELGYYLSKQTAISLAGRFGFPVGANIEGHATMGPAGVLRVRHALAASGVGLHVNGSVGGGIIRNTIKLTETTEPGMDTDIVAIGPLLVGAGAGYNLALSGSLKMIAELNALAGIPVTKKIGESHLNFGVQLDFSLGLAVGF
jgi:hypothetical protein